MVAFLLQTTSSEDLCSEDSSWPIRTQDLYTPFFSASISSQERLVMERLLVCSPSTAATVLEPPITTKTTLQLEDLFSVAHTTTRSSASEDTAQEDPMSTVIAVTSSAPRLFQNLPRVPSNSAVSVTRSNPRFSKGRDSSLRSEFSSEFCIALFISIRRTFSELHSVYLIISSSNPPPSLHGWP